jgi:hypothetical protein
MGVDTLSTEYTHIERPQDQNITFLLGNVGVWQKQKLVVAVSAAIDFNQSNTLFMEEPNLFTLTNGSSWRAQGFDVGDNFTIQWTTYNIGSGSTTVSTVTGTIVAINDNQMTSSNTTLGAGAQVSNIYPVQLADDKIHSVFIATDAEPQGFDFQLGHLKNSNIDGLNLSSFIDGTDTVFQAAGVDLLTFGQTIPLVPQALQSGLCVAHSNLTYAGVITGGVSPYVYNKYIYVIETVFMIAPYSEDINNFDTNTAPDEFLAKECLTDNYKITVFPQYNNPNVSISNKLNFTKQLGTTGWFNENYNGGIDDFTIGSIEYKNANGTIVNQLDYKNTISFKAVINGGHTNLNGQTKCSYGFRWVPLDEVEYKNLTTPYHENVKVSTGGGYLSDVFPVSNAIDANLRQGYSNDGASMDVQNVRFQQTGVNQITFECDFVPNASFDTFMSVRTVDDRNYIIWINVGNQVLLTNESNRVCKRVAFNAMDTYIEPIGEYSGMNIGFLSHTQDETDTPSICGNSILIEDDLLARIDFLVDSNTGPTIPIPTGLQYGFMLERSSDGLQYILDKYSIDLTQYPDVTQYNFNASRGFKYIAGNSKNLIEAKYYPAINTGTQLGVLGFYGFKVRWEDWLARTNVPIPIRNQFYSNALRSNGLSNDWYRYLNTTDWNLYFYVFTNATLDGTPVQYQNKKQLLFKDYDDNSNVTTVVTYKRESDLSVLTGGTDPSSGLPLGIILSNEPIRVEIEYTRLSGTWASISNVYGVTTIEVRNGAGQPQFRQLSSDIGAELDNPLEPIAGATFLDLTLISSTIIRATCLVNPSKLIQANEYKITGRIGCK